MDDFRIKTSWRKHPKRIKLQRRLGAEAVLALEDLWSWCADGREDGDLCGLSNEDLAIAADYTGDHNTFVTVLVELRLLDGQEGAYRIHDWDEINPYVAGHDGRSASARANINARWHREGKHRGRVVEDCPLCTPVVPNDTNGIRGRKIRNTPDPSPSPYPYPDPSPSPSPDPDRTGTTPVRSNGVVSQPTELTAAQLAQSVAAWGWSVHGIPPRWVPLASKLEPFSQTEVDFARVEAAAQSGRPSAGLLLRIIERVRSEGAAQPRDATGPPRPQLSRKGQDIARAVAGGDLNMFPPRRSHAER